PAAELRRAGRSDGLSLPSGGSPQCGSPRAGHQGGDRPRRSAGGGRWRVAHHASDARRRPRHRCGRAARSRSPRHAGAVARPCRLMRGRRRGGRRHDAAHHHSAAVRAGQHANRRDGMTSALIIDDHPIVLKGCRRMLEDAGVATVLDARDIVSGYRLYRRNAPDVVGIDLALQGSGLGGLALIQRIKARDPRARILVFSMHTDPLIVARALKAGATGYIVKDTSPEEFLEAFDRVRMRTPYLNPDMAVKVALVQTGVHRDPLADLTPRELQTLGLLAEGKSYGRIAEELEVSYKTVVNTCSQLKDKLDAKNLPERIRTAVHHLAPGARAVN